MKIHRRAVLALGVAGATVFALGRSFAETPMLVGPLADTSAQGLQTWNASAQGYVAEEYLLSGAAPVYEPVAMADSLDFATRDNTADQSRRTFTRTITNASQPHTTRIIVYRPRDAARFSGNVSMEVMHPGGGGRAIVWAAINPLLTRNGDAHICVQHPTTFAGLRSTDAARYGALAAAHPSQIWGMLADTGRLLKQGRSLSGVQAQALYLTGYSFTGVATSTFANYHHNDTRLANGRPVFDGYLPMANAMFVRPLDVPVLRMNDESDFNRYGGLNNRGAEGAHYRLYELAGAAHVVTAHGEAGAASPPRDVHVPEGPGLPRISAPTCYAAFPQGSVPNDFPTRLLQAALFRNLQDWVRHGRSPPRGRLIEVDAFGEARRDANGNARGGVRLPTIDVPAATYAVATSEDCFLFGYRLAFNAERMRALYGDHAAYVARVARSARRSVRERLLLPEGAAELASWATASDPF